MVNNLTTIGGWTAIGVIASGVYLYHRYTRVSPTPKQIKQSRQPVEAKKFGKSRKARKDGEQSSSDQATKPSGKGDKKKLKQAAGQDDENKSSTANAIRFEPDKDEVNNKEFARQLSNVKAGTLLPKKSQEGGRQKSVKQSRAQEKANAVETSSDATAPSSAAGGDADDDRSPLNSPVLAATTLETTVTSSGISDMLEAPAPGPSVLKVTAPTNPTPPKNAKAPAAFAPAETKKQRQNRKKAEEKKQAREEEEKGRKKLEEKQRRTAREAEGRAAKDGSTFMASKAPTSSAWKAPSATINGNDTKKENEKSNGKGDSKRELLDTYDSSAAEPVSSENEASGSGWQNLAGGLSEEEQIRMALDDSDTWETVQSKEAKRGKKKAVQSASEETTENKEPTGTYQKNFEDPPLIAPTGPGQKWKMTLVATEPNGEKVEYEKEVQDSEWEVAY